MLLVCLIGSFAKVVLICFVAWFATDIANNLLLLDFVVCPLQMILVFELLLIFFIFPFKRLGWKYSSFKIYKTPSVRLVVEYLGCRPQGVGFQVPELIRAAQTRPSEVRERK